MSQKRKAVVVGGGGTLAYYALLLVIGWIADRFQSNAAFTMMIIIGFPLLPSMMPGFILSLLLAVLGVRGFDGPHDTLFALWPIVSAPLVNSYFALIWIKRRQIARAA
jgi:hypothetical protein